MSTEEAIEKGLGALRATVKREQFIASTPAVKKAWKAAEEAIGAISDKKDALASLGDEALTRFLEAVAGREDYRAELENLAEKASAEEIVSAVEAGTERLRAELEARARRREELLQLAGRLGVIGAKLLISIL